MPGSIHLVLAPGAALELEGAVARALSLLEGAGATEEALAAQVESDAEAAARLHVALARLTVGGAIHFAARDEEGLIATLEPRTPYFQLAPREPDPDRPARLSRFAYVRRDGERMVLESPRVHARVVLEARAFALVPALAAPRPAGSAPLSGLLWRAGFLVDAGPGGETEEERAPIALWEFHDLLFHARSRRREHGQGIGATWRLADAVAPLPAVVPPAGEVVALPAPDLAQLAKADPPLVEVMERRRSIREHGPKPFTAAQLGELLFRCARVRERFAGPRDELSRRPYPSGGARYPLEIYATVRACEGLAPGLYRYDPEGHRLEVRAGMTPSVRKLLQDAKVGSSEPEALLTLAARFGRASWKYESIAYATILKDAGVLLEAFYLAATAMGLAVCGVGHGDPDLFERAAGLQGSAESSVAELVVGSKPSPG